MIKDKETPAAMYHGSDEKAKTEAVKRAHRINGYVILSKPPEGTVAASQAGYWSDLSGFVRTWETLIWPEPGR